MENHHLLPLNPMEYIHALPNIHVHPHGSGLQGFVQEIPSPVLRPASLEKHWTWERDGGPLIPS